MESLSPKDYKRFTDIIAQLSSSFDPVKLVAIAALERFLAERGMRFRDLGDIAVRGFCVRPEPSKPKPSLDDIVATIRSGGKIFPNDPRYDAVRTMARDLLARLAPVLPPYEAKLYRSMSEWTSQISEKQVSMMASIAASAQRREPVSMEQLPFLFVDYSDEIAPANAWRVDRLKDLYRAVMLRSTSADRLAIAEVLAALNDIDGRLSIRWRSSQAITKYRDRFNKSWTMDFEADGAATAHDVLDSKAAPASHDTSAAQAKATADTTVAAP
jgi:hypothetical protein